MIKSEYLLSPSELRFCVIPLSPPSMIIPSSDPSSGPINPILSLKSCSTAERDTLLTSGLGRLLVPERRLGENIECAEGLPRPLSFLMNGEWVYRCGRRCGGGEGISYCDASGERVGELLGV